MRLGSTALADQRLERRLAAIIDADVAGFSRLVGADEEGTLARLKTHRRELIDPKIAEHKGRILGLGPRAKTTGACILAGFPSAVDARSVMPSRPSGQWSTAMRHCPKTSACPSASGSSRRHRG